MVVSVRIPDDDLRKLQLIARVTEQSVGAIIRTALNEHIETISTKDEFRKKATEMQDRYERILKELVEPSRKRASTRKRRAKAPPSK